MTCKTKKRKPQVKGKKRASTKKTRRVRRGDIPVLLDKIPTLIN